jgi:transcriptional regulator of arginine metabolism
MTEGYAQEQELGNGYGGPAVPQTRTARHRRIVDILNRQPVRSQSQLAKLLADDGLSVTQATLSRDLDELRRAGPPPPSAPSARPAASAWGRP